MSGAPIDKSPNDGMVTASGSASQPRRKGCFYEREEGVYLWAHWLANYPWLVIVCVLAVSFILAAAAFTRSFELDSTGGGFVPRTDPIGVRKDSVLAAFDNTYFTVNSTALPGWVVQARQGVPGPTLAILYVKDRRAIQRDGGDINILSPAAIAEMAAFERLFAQRANFSDYCLLAGSSCVPPFSLVNYAYPPAGQGATQVTNQTALWGSIPPSALAFMVEKTYAQRGGEGTDLGAPLTIDSFRFPANISSQVVQSLFTFGYPLAGFNNSQNLLDQQNARYDRWISSQRSFFAQWNANSSEVDLLWAGQGISKADTDALLINDALWAIGACIFVLAWLIFHTTSVWLSLWAIFHIILSFPISYFFIRVAMNVRQFNTLNMLGLFIVLGIGADDVFIMVDRWKQSAFEPQCRTHATRMAWAFKSAARSMFVTSFTTALAFFCNASSTIAPIRIFGIFCGTLILVNYGMVITMFPAVVSLWGKYFENKCLDAKLKKLSHAKHDAVVFTPPKTPLEAERQKIKSMRLLERFFYFKYFKFVAKLCFLLLALVLALWIAMVVLSSFLQPAQAPSAFLPASNPIQRAIDLRANAFVSTPSRVTVNLYFGVSGIDRTGTDPNNVLDIGRPVYNPQFDLSSPEAQNYMISVCEAARVQPTTLAGQVLCPLNDLRDWLVAQGRPFPSLNIQADFREYADFFTANRTVPFEGSRSSFSGVTLSKAYTSTVRFDNVTGRLAMVQLIVNTTISPSAPASQLRPSFEQWEAFVAAQRPSAPVGVQGWDQISDRWVTITVEDALYSNAIFGIWTSMLVAFGVLLLLTLNLFTSLISMVSIGAVVTCVIGTIVAVGWSLGIIESISLSIVTGLAVDYSAHMGDSYNDSHKGLRHGRTRDMLATIGLSVFSAGATTLGSAFFLFGTTIVFFYRFGAFIAITVGYSCVYAFLCMPAMLYLFGPQRNEGNLRWFFRHKPKWLADFLQVPESWPDESGQLDQVYDETDTELTTASTDPNVREQNAVETEDQSVVML